MKLLLDQNLSFKLCQRLDDIFPGSAQVRMVGLEHADDKTIWDYARAEGFVLVSHDADFAELAVLRGPPPHVVWLRCGNQPTAVIEQVLRSYAESILNFERESVAACLEIY